MRRSTCKILLYLGIAIFGIFVLSVLFILPKNEIGFGEIPSFPGLVGVVLIIIALIINGIPKKRQAKK